MGHSPGPWTWNPNDHSRNVLEDGKGEPIALYYELFSREQEAANKALIAAAPRMLELLRKHEWSGCDNAGQEECPECFGIPRPEVEGGRFGHEPDCAWGALLDELKKAGV